ncbi:hypothetical protein PAXRUDRAFT_767937, partial [Paxillus rubicundulus Ve08.2h10]
IHCRQLPIPPASVIFVGNELLYTSRSSFLSEIYSSPVSPNSVIFITWITFVLTRSGTSCSPRNRCDIAARDEYKRASGFGSNEYIVSLSPPALPSLLMSHEPINTSPVVCITDIITHPECIHHRTP